MLALTYTFTGQQKYAEKSASMIRTWFIDESTKMNPHLEFAQSVPGNPKPRRSGILDGRVIAEHILDSITLIKSSGFWSEQDDSAMRSWLGSYLKWVTENKLGQRAAFQTNNHGSWYYFQVIAIAAYLGEEKKVAWAVESAKSLLLDTQFLEDGSQPRELARTRAFAYSCFNLKALSSVATIAHSEGYDLWSYKNNNNKSHLSSGIEYLIPFVKEPNLWPHESIDLDPDCIVPVLAMAKRYYLNKQYQDMLSGFIRKTIKSDRKNKYLKWLILYRPQDVLGGVDG